MRTKSVLSAFIAGLALSLSACAPQAELVDEPAVSETKSAPADQSVDAMAGTCKLAWTCNYQRYYTTKAQCTAACGSQPCEQDYACTGGCVCP